MPHKHRTLKALATSTLALILAATAFTFYLLFPQPKSPEPADVVLVLAGANDGRHQRGAEIAQQLGIPNLVISNPNGQKDQIGYSYCAGAKLPSKTATWCLDPHPITTAGEAMTFNDLASNEGWESAIIVTNRPHSRRVKTIFDDCTTINTHITTINNIDYARLPYHVTREAAGFIKHWITDPCTDQTA